MKTRVTKTLALNKETVSRLNREDMKHLEGGTINLNLSCGCTESCTILGFCCGPTTTPKMAALNMTGDCI